jgi:hypothetical protein
MAIGGPVGGPQLGGGCTGTGARTAEGGHLGPGPGPGAVRPDAGPVGPHVGAASGNVRATGPIEAHTGAGSGGPPGAGSGGPPGAG